MTEPRAEELKGNSGKNGIVPDAIAEALISMSAACSQKNQGRQGVVIHRQMAVMWGLVIVRSKSHLLGILF